MAYYGSYAYYGQPAPPMQPPVETSTAPQIPTKLTRQPSSASLSGVVISEPLVVENRSTYFEHEQRIKDLEEQIEQLSAQTRRAPEAFQEFEDEDEEEDLQTFEVGDEVEGLYYNGRWYPAKIAEIDNGFYLLDWDDKDTQDRLKTASELRKSRHPLGIEMQSMLYSKMKSRYEIYNPEETLAYSGKVVYVVQWIEEEAFIRVLDGSPLNYKLGDKVEGFYTRTGKWYNAVIAEVKKNGIYVLDWDDEDTVDREKMIHHIRRQGTDSQLIDSWEAISRNTFMLLSMQKYKLKEIKGSIHYTDPSKRIAQINCKTAKLRDQTQFIQQISFMMVDGNSKSWTADIDEKEILPDTEAPASPGIDRITRGITAFRLQEDEVLTEIEVKQKVRKVKNGKDQSVVEGLRFITSKNRPSEWFGNSQTRGGDLMAITSPSNPITGLDINSGASFSSIQSVVLADETRQPLVSYPITVGPNRLEDPKFATVKEQCEGKEDEYLRLKIQLLRERGEDEDSPALSRNASQVYTVELRFKHDASAYVENDITSYAKPGLKESFDLIDASDKVITLLSRITMSNKWIKCSPNIYGFFIRNVLLGGSSFEGQVVPQTQNVLILSIVGVLLTFGMQFALSWYLWKNLPFNLAASASNGGGNPLIDRVWDPDQNGHPIYSICRTHPLVQVMCIGLFLFYMLNSTPAIIKNVLIILWSHHFVSRDVNGVSRIHYWRTSSWWAGLLYQGSLFLRKLKVIKDQNVCVPFPMQVVDWKVLRFFRERENFFLPLSKILFNGTMSPADYVIPKDASDDLKKQWEEIEARDWVKPFSQDSQADDRRIHYELQEAKAFFRRKLSQINSETFAVDEDDEDEQDKENREAMMDVVRNTSSGRERNKLKEQLEELESDKKTAKIIRTTEAANYLVALDYCDGDSLAEVRRIKTGYFAMSRSIIAILFGVVPEVVATMMILICGCQYILWSGSQIGSNTNGLEEIILATVAITFISDIDEALFEHALPELYKTAHDLDEFNVENWIPAEEPAEMEDLSHKSSIWLPFGRFIFWPRNANVELSGTQSLNEKDEYSMTDFLRCMSPGKYYDHMSREQHSDLNFAKQYPFLYARKYKYFFQEHFLEGFVWAYGSLGLHIIALTGVSLAIVGAIRIGHDCTGNLGPFSPQQWPDTCDNWQLQTAALCN